MADDVYTPAQWVILTGLDKTPGGRAIVEKEAAAVKQANFDKVTNWMELAGNSMEVDMQDIDPAPKIQNWPVLENGAADSPFNGPTN